MKNTQNTLLVLTTAVCCVLAPGARAQSTHLVDTIGQPVLRTGTNNAYMGDWPSSARFLVSGAGEPLAPTDAGNKDATILVSSTAGGPGDGGGYALGFGHGSYLQSYFAEMKAWGTDGSGNTVGDLVFFLRAVPTNTELSEVMRVCHDGKVGIGRTPLHALDVEGKIKASRYFVLPADTDHEWWAGAFTDHDSWQLTRRSIAGSWVNALTVDTACQVGVGTPTPQATLDVCGSGRFSGTVTCQVLELTSDPSRKTGLAAVDCGEILAKLAKVPISTWHYADDTNTVHIGPMADSFHETFGVGTGNKTISVIDGLGVAFAAIHGLDTTVERQLAAKDARIAELENTLARFRQDILARVGSLERHVAVCISASDGVGGGGAVVMAAPAATSPGH